MASGISKLQVILDIKNKLSAGLDTAAKHVQKTTGAITDKVKGFSLENSKAFGAIKSEIPGVGNAISLLTNPYIAATAAVAAFATFSIKAIKKADEWHTKMAEINVTAELSKKQLRDLSDNLLEIGGRNSAPLEEVPKAFNRIISAGLSVNDSLKALEPTLRAAKAGFADIEVVASAAISVMQSSGESVTKVYDILFETVKEGNAEFKDIAQYLPKIIPLARNVGFAFDETAGAYASLTTKLSAEQSTTSLQGIMRALSSQRIAVGVLDKETKKYISGFKSIGMDIYDSTTGKIKPLLEIVKELSTKMTGLTDKQRMLKFEKLGLDQMGAIGFATLIQDVSGLQKAISATATSQGSLEKAYTDSLTPMEKWKTIQNQLKVAVIKFGELFLPLVSKAGEMVLRVVDFIKNLWKESELFRGSIKAIGFVLKILTLHGIMPLIAIKNIIKGLFSLFSDLAGAINRIFEKITGIQGGFKNLYTYIKPYLIWLKEFISQIGNLLFDVFTLNYRGAKDKIKNFQLPQMKDIQLRVKQEAEKENKADDFLGKQSDKGGIIENPLQDKENPLSSIKEGSQTKNITINIGSFVKEYHPTNPSINNMNKEQFEKWLQEIFIKVVRGAELTM